MSDSEKERSFFYNTLYFSLPEYILPSPRPLVERECVNIGVHGTTCIYGMYYINILNVTVHTTQILDYKCFPCLVLFGCLLCSTVLFFYLAHSNMVYFLQCGIMITYKGYSMIIAPITC